MCGGRVAMPICARLANQMPRVAYPACRARSRVCRFDHRSDGRNALRFGRESRERGEGNMQLTLAMTTLQRISITKADLDRIPLNERRNVILLAHAANELNTFSRLFRFTLRQPDADDVVMQAHGAQTLAIARVLASKAWETWQLLSKGFLSSATAKTYEAQFSDDDKASFNAVKKYFKGGSPFSRIRNKLGFHYDLDAIDKGYANLQPSDDLNAYISKYHTNTFYAFAETVAGHTMLELVCPGDPQKAFQILIGDMEEMAGTLAEVTSAIIAACLEIHCGDVRTSKREIIPLKDAPDAQSITIPFFVTVPD